MGISPSQIYVYIYIYIFAHHMVVLGKEKLPTAKLECCNKSLKGELTRQVLNVVHIRNTNFRQWHDGIVEPWDAYTKPRNSYVVI